MLADTTDTTGGDPYLGFEAFITDVGPRLEAVLTAHYGAEIGPDAAADARAYAWQHWERIQRMDNPVGYLYRVGQSATRRHLRWRRHPVLPPVPPGMEGAIDPDLPRALARLSRQQRVAVILVHALGWTYDEAAASMDISVSTLRNHLNRGLARLHTLLGDSDA